MTSNRLATFLKSRRETTMDPLTGRPYTQVGIAQALGITRSKMNALENGVIESIDAGTANNLARVLGLSVNEICRAAGFDIESARLTEQEADVIQILRRLPEDRRAILVEMLRGAARGALLT